MINATILPWTEPLAVAARRRHLRSEMRQQVIPNHVLEAMRQERAGWVKVASTMAGTIEWEGAAS